MSAPTFTPIKTPIVGKQVTTTYRTLDAGFGDGYSQVTVDGLNAQVAGVNNLTWNALSLADCTSITNQLDTFAGTTFSYQIPGDSVARLWRCKTRTVDDTDATSLILTATLAQAFDLS